MKASISIITYNHEKFIRQALDSVLMQEVDFDYEIVIGEDCSTDKTRDILLNYHDQHPDKIRLLLPEKNQGLIRNFVNTYQSCKGEYIATLDGDDYWTSPDKLQSQVEYLDRNPDCSMCFHAVTYFYDDGIKPRFLFPEHPKDIFTIEDLLVSNFIPTCAVMFRNHLFGDFPEWYYLLRMEDWPLHILNAQYGKIGFIDGVMGAYRMHSGGVWSMKNDLYTYQEDIKFYQHIDSHFNNRYHRIIRERLDYLYMKLALLCDRNEDMLLTRKYVVKSLLLHPFGNHLFAKMKLVSKTCSPAFYRYIKDIKNAVAGNNK